MPGAGNEGASAVTKTLLLDKRKKLFIKEHLQKKFFRTSHYNFHIEKTQLHIQVNLEQRFFLTGNSPTGLLKMLVCGITSH